MHTSISIWVQWILSHSKCSHSFVIWWWSFSHWPIVRLAVGSLLADAAMTDPCDGSIFGTITCASCRLCSTNRHGFLSESVSSLVLSKWVTLCIRNVFEVVDGSEWYIPLASFSALYARIALPRLSCISLSNRTKMPCFGLHEKYCWSWTVPSFLPVGVSNSMPIHVPPCEHATET